MLRLLHTIFGRLRDRWPNMVSRGLGVALRLVVPGSGAMPMGNYNRVGRLSLLWSYRKANLRNRRLLSHYRLMDSGRIYLNVSILMF